MSPPTSSSSPSSKSQRRPLHERSKSDSNKLSAIRLVPYSPPRLSHGESEPGSSHGTSSSATGADSSNYEYHTTSDEGSSSPTIREGRGSRKGSLPFIIGTGSASPSPTSSTASLVRAKGKGVSGSKLGSDLSGAPTPQHPVNSKASYGSNNSRLNPPSDTSEYGDPATPTQKFVRSKADRFINVHEDKTFSIVLKPTGIRQPRDQGSSSQGTSFKSPPVSYASTLSSAHERFSFDTTTVDHPSSPPSSVADVNLSPYTPYAPGFASYTPGSKKINDRIEEEVDPITSSPNYRMVGGLRKVRKTDSFSQDNEDDDNEDEEDEEEHTQPQLPPLPEVPSSPPRLPSPLAEKTSFSSVSSGQTDSSLEELANFEVLGQSSPPLPRSRNLESTPSPTLPYSDNFNATPSSNPNYQILGESSPSQPFASSPNPGFSNTPASQNYVVHGEPSSSSLGTSSREPRPQTSDDSLVLRGKYSQESLVIPPLIPRKQPSRERFGYNKQKSSHSLRRANSFSSLSSIITEGSASIFFAQTANIIRLGAAPALTSFHPPQRAKTQHHSWAGPSSLVAQRPRMEAHPHQWSSQLSTVASEDETSDRTSRPLSSFSGPDYRMSQGSRHSRQMLSISSSLALAEEPPIGSSHSNRGSTSGSESRGSLVSPGIASPSSAYMRGGRDNVSQPIRVVRDVDEDGDGITDLHDLMHKNSSRLLSSKSSDDNLYSSSSSGRRPTSRTGSFTSTLPVWAKLYYGSGERRWAAAPSMRSYSDDSRPGSAAIPSGSPSVDPFPPNVFSPRRRPREIQPNNGRPQSIEIDPMDPSNSSGFIPIPRRLRKMSSSIWSPHLQIDRRASRFSIWAPPSTTWSKDKGKLGRRNMQIVMFALGWIFPFAWMIAAVLPLPHKPLPQMTMADHHSTAELGGQISTPDIFSGRVDPVEDSNYQSARWWRNVNRLMCVVGLLIIGAIVALAIIGTRENWGK
ncbi:hypothetical protein PG993_010193 [Apiospora rasikravindrae]|uniref:Serine-rich protein n=1 Tax=Apiospora rasikravindrae TaxID=990691 RepID=A0ABR1SLK6_9PEZI